MRIITVAALLCSCLLVPGTTFADEPDAPFSPTLAVSGYLQAHYRAHFETNGDGETTSDDFRVQRVRLEVKGEVLRDVGYDLEIDPRAPEITGVLRDAFVSLNFIPHHRLRIGQQKTQFGSRSRRTRPPT